MPPYAGSSVGTRRSRLTRTRAIVRERVPARLALGCAPRNSGAQGIEFGVEQFVAERKECARHNFACCDDSGHSGDRCSVLGRRLRFRNE
jgi:hypothetical protein